MGEPKIDLGVKRTILAARRTLMAWVRTALSMISFGFTIYKFLHALATTHERSPRRLGIILATIGTTSLAVGMTQYLLVFHAMGDRRPGFSFYVACAVVVLGMLVLAGLVLRIGPFN